MSETKSNDSLLQAILSIKKEVAYIKTNMVEKDDFLTKEEFLALEKSKNKKNLISFRKVKKELKL